jgi:hypothetical protein
MRPDDILSRAKDATAGLEPPPGFAPRVVALARTRRRSGWGQVEFLGRFAVPCAAAMTLAWMAERPADASAMEDDTEEMP